MPVQGFTPVETKNQWGQRADSFKRVQLPPPKKRFPTLLYPYRRGKRHPGIMLGFGVEHLMVLLLNTHSYWSRGIFFWLTHEVQ